jgi:hypothetical protein
LRDLALSKTYSDGKTVYFKKRAHELEHKITENVLFCTDDELVMLVNEIFLSESQFSYEAFSKWKRGERQSDNALHEDFVCIKKKPSLLKKRTY